MSQDLWCGAQDHLRASQELSGRTFLWVSSLIHTLSKYKVGILLYRPQFWSFLEHIHHEEPLCAPFDLGNSLAAPTLHSDSFPLRNISKSCVPPVAWSWAVRGDIDLVGSFSGIKLVRSERDYHRNPRRIDQCILIVTSCSWAPCVDAHEALAYYDLQYLRVSIHLQPPSNISCCLRVWCLLFAASSSLIKSTAIIVGSFVFSPLRSIVPFVVFIDFLNIASFHWWLVGRIGYQFPARPQVQSVSCYYSGLTCVLLAIALVGVICGHWLLSLEVL